MTFKILVENSKHLFSPCLLLTIDSLSNQVLLQIPYTFQNLRGKLLVTYFWFNFYNLLMTHLVSLTLVR